MRRPLLFSLLLCGCTSFTAGTPSGLADASAPDEAGARDGGAREAGAGSRTCDQSHMFCEDFDRATPFSGWQTTGSGAELETSTERHVSAPSALKIEMGPSNNSDHPAYLARTFEASQRILVTARVHVALNGSPDGEIDVLALDLKAPAGLTRYFASIVVKAAGTWVLELAIDDGKQTVDLGPIGPGFDHLSLEIDLTNGRVAGGLNGSTKQLGPHAAVGLGHELRVGAAFASNRQGSFTILADDVTLDH